MGYRWVDERLDGWMRGCIYNYCLYILYSIYYILYIIFIIYNYAYVYDWWMNGWKIKWTDLCMTN